MRQTANENNLNSEIESLKSTSTAFPIYAASVQLKKQGKEWKGRCSFPNHKDDTASFTLTEKNGVLLFHCFGCNRGGDVFQFLQEMSGCLFSEAVEKVKSLAGWKSGADRVKQVFQPLDSAPKQYETLKLADLTVAERELEVGGVPLAWLESRCIRLETAKKHHLGFIPSVARVSPNHEFVDKGWIVFPTINREKITLLKFRSVAGKAFVRKANMESSLYNIETVSPFEDIFVVEGEVDCLSLEQAGYRSVALPGANYNLSDYERSKLIQADRIFLAGDTDAPGQQAMAKLWTELRDRTYLLKWPDTKDANEALVKLGGNIENFKTLVESLKHAALEQPMPFMHDLSQSLYHVDDTSPLDNPARLRFPWPKIDRWACIKPGDIMVLSATETGTGKTAWLMNVLMENAIMYGKTVLNYSAEVSPEDYARRAAAYLTGKNRDALGRIDFELAAKKMKDAKFYNGYKPGANWKDVVDLLKLAKCKLGADILVIDHLHFLTRSEKDEIKSQSEAMRAFKDLALEYGTIVIVVGQPRKPKDEHFGRQLQMRGIKGSEALPIGTKILTPQGFKSIESISMGDIITGRDGKPTKVTGVYWQGLRQCHQVTFSDGGKVVCSEGHLWAVKSPNHRRRERQWRVLSTDRIIEEGLSWKGTHRNRRWHIPLVDEVSFSEHKVPLDAYVAGILLGDGGFTALTPTVTSVDREIQDAVSDKLPEGVSLNPCKDGKSFRLSVPEGCRVNPLTELLRNLGIWGHKSEEKFIPCDYKYASVEDRISLLQGLLDADGNAPNGGGKIRFCTTSICLARDFTFLVRSLGGLAYDHVYPPPEHGNYPTHVFSVYLPRHIRPFRLARKQESFGGRIRKERLRNIVAIDSVGEREVICLKVEANDGLFVTEDFIVTHNSLSSDASQVFILHRQRLSEEGDDIAVFSPETKVILDKSRESEGRVTKLLFRGETCRFVEMPNGHEESS